MNAYKRNSEVFARIVRESPSATLHDAAVLCRAQVTLHRWAELECGDGNDYASWCIERETVFRTGDGKTFPTLEQAKAHAEYLVPVIVGIEECEGRPVMARYPHQGKPSRTLVADRERGALKRIASVCERLGLHYFHQTDPRGCALYVAREALTDSQYSRGIACC